jgi:hypothetical protein
MSQVDKVMAFIEGLREPIAGWVRFYQPKTIDDAYETADKCETYKIGHTNHQTSRVFSAQTNQHNKQQQKCTFCNRNGHTIETCRLKATNQTPTNYQTNQNQINNNTKQVTSTNNNNSPDNKRKHSDIIYLASLYKSKFRPY